GSNRLIRLPALITCQKLRLRIIKAAASIALSDFALFREPVADQEPVADSDQATFPREGTGSGQVQGQGQVDGLGQMQVWDKEQVADMGNSPSYLASPKSGWKISSTVELVNGQYAIDGDSRTIAVS